LTAAAAITLAATSATSRYSGPCSTICTGLPELPSPPGVRGTTRAPGTSRVRICMRATICSAVSGRSPQGSSGRNTMPLLTEDWLFQLPVRRITREALPRRTSSIAISNTWSSWRCMYSRLAPSGDCTMICTRPRSSRGASSVGRRMPAQGQPTTSSRITAAAEAPAAPSSHRGLAPASDQRNAPR
jgi:hypothetical protein